MNIFATIVPLRRFTQTKVKIYTIQIEENDELRPYTEFADWLQRHKDNPEVKRELNEIASWIQVISEGKHDLHTLLRHERAAHALPPQNKWLRVKFGQHLRLYCMVIGNRTLVLFNGGIKSAAKAQECPRVGPYFTEANRLCEAIQAALTDQLGIDYATGEFKNPENIELSL